MREFEASGQSTTATIEYRRPLFRTRVVIGASQSVALAVSRNVVRVNMHSLAAHCHATVMSDLFGNYTPVLPSDWHISENP